MHEKVINTTFQKYSEIVVVVSWLIRGHNEPLYFRQHDDGGWEICHINEPGSHKLMSSSGCSCLGNSHARVTWGIMNHFTSGMMMEDGRFAILMSLARTSS